MIQLKIMVQGQSKLFDIKPKNDEVFNASGWVPFVYPSLLSTKDYASLDFFTEYEDSFDVIEYAYIEGYCVSDSINFCNDEDKDCSFSYEYLINGSLANYSQVYEALNQGENNEI
jgi:hypothetical protein